MFIFKKCVAALALHDLSADFDVTNHGTLQEYPENWSDSNCFVLDSVLLQKNNPVCYDRSKLIRSKTNKYDLYSKLIGTM